MTADRDPQTSQPGIDLPNLRSFFRGYFHQDMKDEYGSPEEAVREFCGRRRRSMRPAVAREWSQFIENTKGQPLDTVNRILTGPLGSSYALSPEDIAILSSVFSQALRRK